MLCVAVLVRKPFEVICLGGLTYLCAEFFVRILVGLRLGWGTDFRAQTTNLAELKSVRSLGPGDQLSGHRANLEVRALKMVSMLRPLRLIGKTSSVRLIIEAVLQSQSLLCCSLP